MNIRSYLDSPITLIFLVIAIGLFVGKLKIFRISLDLSAILIISVFFGYLVMKCNLITDVNQVKEIISHMKKFSSLGTSVFVSVIGISAGYTLKTGIKETKAMLVGAIMTVVSFVSMKVIVIFDNTINFSRMIGALCGALTTTPGLSAACETNGIISEEAILGYGSTYIFGVLLTVFIVQITTKKLKINQNDKCLNTLKSSAIYGGLLQVCLTIILGRILGKILFPCINISLGDSGGILITGIIVGVLVNKKLSEKLILPETITFMKNFGLSLFLGSNGLSAGMQLVQGTSFKVIIYGIIMTIIPILAGWIICRFIINYNKLESAAIICGGMTSTPAIGLLTQNKANISLSNYSLAYFGALVTIVLLIRIF